MLVTIYVETDRQYYTYSGDREDYFSEGEYVTVDVPLMKIAEILAKDYKIPAETMHEIICCFDIDLEDEIENNDEIQELAHEIYRKECM